MTTLPPLQKAIRDLEYLEEIQGLTPPKIAAYLEATGWIADTGGYAYRYKGEHSTMPAYPSIMTPCLHVVARVEGISVQALARKMNPRWMGLPTVEQWIKHGRETGLWLARPTRASSMERALAYAGGAVLGLPILIHLHLIEGRPYRWDWYLPGKGFSAFENTPCLWDFWPVDDDGNRIDIGALS
jgi:hypothetical protein